MSDRAFLCISENLDIETFLLISHHIIYTMLKFRARASIEVCEFAVYLNLFRLNLVSFRAYWKLPQERRNERAIFFDC